MVDYLDFLRIYNGLFFELLEENCGLNLEVIDNYG
jgi:hypothetical protein